MGWSTSPGFRWSIWPDFPVYELAAKSEIAQFLGLIGKNADEITIFPNPCPYDQPIIITTDNEFVKLNYIEVQTTLGQVIFSKELSNEQSYVLSIGTEFKENFKGIIILRIKTINTLNNEVLTNSRKIIIN